MEETRTDDAREGGTEVVAGEEEASAPWGGERPARVMRRGASVSIEQALVQAAAENAQAQRAQAEREEAARAANAPVAREKPKTKSFAEILAEKRAALGG